MKNLWQKNNRNGSIYRRTDEPNRLALIKLKFLLNLVFGIWWMYLINYRTSDNRFLLAELVRCQSNSTSVLILDLLSPVLFFSLFYSIVRRFYHDFTADFCVLLCMMLYKIYYILFVLMQFKIENSCFDCPKLNTLVSSRCLSFVCVDRIFEISSHRTTNLFTLNRHRLIDKRK